jgi:hypothetical protein
MVRFRSHSDIKAHQIACLRTLRDLDFFCCGQVGAVDGVGFGYFGDTVGMEVVGSGGEILPEGISNSSVSFFKVKCR